MSFFKKYRYHLRHQPVFYPSRKHALGMVRMEKRNKRSNGGLEKKMKLKKKFKLLQCVILPSSAGKLLFEEILFCALHLR